MHLPYFYVINYYLNNYIELNKNQCILCKNSENSRNGRVVKLYTDSYIRGLDYNDICVKLAEYEIGEKLEFGIGNLLNNFNKAGDKQKYFSNILNEYKHSFPNQQSAADWFVNKKLVNRNLYINTFKNKY